jgi:hypothetical protein
MIEGSDLAGRNKTLTGHINVLAHYSFIGSGLNL